MPGWTRDHVLAAILHYFPGEELPTILALLDAYGTESDDAERARVQVAILRVSGGNTAKLIAHIAQTTHDSRDVLRWSDTLVDAPVRMEEIWMRPLPPPPAGRPSERARAVLRDARRHLRSLNGGVDEDRVVAVEPLRPPSEPEHEGRDLQ